MNAVDGEAATGHVGGALSAAEGETAGAARQAAPASRADVVGIDLSLTATGIATPEGLFTIKVSIDGPSIKDRLGRVERIVSMIRNHAPGGDLAVIEGPSYGQRQQAGEHLRAGLWWMTVAALVPWYRPVEIPPATLKKFATGKGNATKPDMRMSLFQRADLDIRDDNQVDAWWLRELGLHLLGEPSITLPKTHTIALDKIRIGAPA